MRDQSHQTTTGWAFVEFSAAVLTRAVLGGAIGVTAGVLFALLFGAVDGLLNLDAWRLTAAVPYFAICAAGSGAITGAVSRVIDGLYPFATAEKPERSSGPSARPEIAGARFRKVSIPGPLLARAVSLGGPATAPREPSSN